MTSLKSLNKPIVRLDAILLFLEGLIFASFIFSGFYLAFLKLTCEAEDCLSIPSVVDISIAVFRFALPVIAMISCLRIAINVRDNNLSDRAGLHFYLSLFSLFVCYLIFGIFADQFLALTIRQATTSLLYSVEMLILIGTTISFFQDTATFEISTWFVKIRLIVSILLMVVLVISPFLGLLVSVPVLLIMYIVTYFLRFFDRALTTSETLVNIVI